MSHTAEVPVVNVSPNTLKVGDIVMWPGHSVPRQIEHVSHAQIPAGERTYTAYVFKFGNRVVILGGEVFVDKLQI